MACGECSGIFFFDLELVFRLMVVETAADGVLPHRWEGEGVGGFEGLVWRFRRYFGAMGIVKPHPRLPFHLL